VRFGVFEARLNAGELHKQGMRVRLRGQPFDILAMLVERPGELVTREELRDRLWAADSFVDFDHGLNAAVNRLREALGDSADNPRFVETVPRRGYRFIAPAVVVSDAPPAPRAVQAPPLTRFLPKAAPRRRWRAWVGGAALALGITAALLWQRAWAPAPPKHSTPTRIAVLPLKNPGGDPAQDYLVDGLTDALITDLGQVTSVRVVSRTSAMAYKGSAKPLPQIARELNADAVVVGSAVQSGPRVRLSVRLVDGFSEQPLWAETHERDVTDVLALQGTVARGIARGAGVRLTPPEEVRLARAAPVDAGAYEAWLRGRFFRETLPDDGLPRGIAAFEDAVKRDPSFVPAYVGLADGYWRLGAPGLEKAPRSETAPKARAAALKALELDPRSAQAQAALALVEMDYDGDWKRGEARMKRALAANPSLSGAHLSYSACLSGVGRFDEAVTEAQLGLDLDPLSVTAGETLGLRLFEARQYDRALLHLQRTLELVPTSFAARLILARCHWQRHDWKRAIPEAERALADSEMNLWTLAWLGYSYGASGDRTQGRSVLASLETLSKERHVPAFYRAVIHLGLDENDEAMAALQEAFQERSGWMALLGVEPELDRLRGDPRFVDLVGRVGRDPGVAPGLSPGTDAGR